jgi:uncharacterized protein (DUF302 family)/rhodanese-related sulfurtransferase
MLATSYTLSTTTERDFTAAIDRVRDELKSEGFGILCEIDVQATLKEKLGIDGDPYIILGACNPPLAHQALTAEPELGALLPCNVVVYRRDNTTHIAAIDADRMLSLVGNDDLAPIASQVRDTRASSTARRNPEPMRFFARTTSTDPASVAQRLAARSVHVLDVRQAGEWRHGHISGSQNVPLLHLKGHLAALPREKTIVTVCASGHRSAAAARTLRRAGYQVENLKGGMHAWTKADLPTEKRKRR